MPTYFTRSIYVGAMHATHNGTGLLKTKTIGSRRGHEPISSVPRDGSVLFGSLGSFWQPLGTLTQSYPRSRVNYCRIDTRGKRTTRGDTPNIETSWKADFEKKK